MISSLNRRAPEFGVEAWNSHPLELLNEAARELCFHTFAFSIDSCNYVKACKEWVDPQISEQVSRGSKRDDRIISVLCYLVFDV